jgi:hypothetical protein
MIIGGKMNCFERIIALLSKKRKGKSISEVNLNRWNKLLTLNGTWITTAINLNKIEDIGKALIYSNKNTQERFIKEASESGFKQEAQQIKDYLAKNHNISKINSDRMKAIVANAFTEKRNQLYNELLPPGWI